MHYGCVPSHRSSPWHQRMNGCRLVSTSFIILMSSLSYGSLIKCCPCGVQLPPPLPCVLLPVVPPITQAASAVASGLHGAAAPVASASPLHGLHGAVAPLAAAPRLRGAVLPPRGLSATTSLDAGAATSAAPMAAASLLPGLHNAAALPKVTPLLPGLFFPFASSPFRLFSPLRTVLLFRPPPPLAPPALVPPLFLSSPRSIPSFPFLTSPHAVSARDEPMA